MTERDDSDVIPQVVQFVENRNCACCRYLSYYTTFGNGVTLECDFDGGPIWGAIRDPYPYPPGKTCCQLFVDEVLL